MARYIGKEMSRVDGVAKVTGKAKYAAEFKVPNLAYGFLVMSTIAKGTIKSIDTKEASGAAGVIRIFTHENYPKLAATAFCGLAPISWISKRYSLKKTTRSSILSALREWVNSVWLEFPRQLPMLFFMRRENACAICQSRLTNCYEYGGSELIGRP